MMTWNKGIISDFGIWHKHWYSDIINSTTFKIAKNIKPPKVDVKYKKIYEECMEIYKIMDKYSI